MVQLELSHINVLSKVDLMEQYGKLGINVLKDCKLVSYFCPVLSPPPQSIWT